MPKVPTITQSKKGPVVQELFYVPNSEKIEVYHYINLKSNQDAVLQRIEKFAVDESQGPSSINDKSLQERVREWFKKNGVIEKETDGIIQLTNKNQVVQLLKQVLHGNERTFFKEISIEDYLKNDSVREQVEKGELFVFFIENTPDLVMKESVVKRLGKRLLSNATFVTRFHYKLIEGKTAHAHSKRFPLKGKYYPLTDFPHHIEVIVDEEGIQ
jgi:hypothetical protein